MGGCDETNKRIFFKSICDRANFCHHIVRGVLAFNARRKEAQDI